MQRIFLKSILLLLVLAFGMTAAASAQDDDAACLNETTVSSELAQILDWSDGQVGLTLMEVLQAGTIKTYCFTQKADCEKSQKDASGGIKSGCYKDDTTGKFCYDLQFSSISAQAGFGNFYGTVTDSTGAILPGVTITLEGQGTPQVQVTNTQGQFRYLGVAAGPWSVKMELEGFATGTTLVIVPADRNAVRTFELTASCEGV